MVNRSRFAQLAALAEILFALALGNIVGVAMYDAIVQAAAIPADAGGVTGGLLAGLRIALRIGMIAAFGFALLRYRRGLAPRDIGLTRAGESTGHLIRIGLLLGAFSSFLVGLVFAVHAIIPLGEGLAAWDEVRVAKRDTAFYVEMLATSIIVPPLVEEIMARGYMRVRLVESFGPIAGVVLTGLVFALAHGKFISTDPMLATFLVMLIISSVAWSYMAQVTGSLIPSMVAHAMTNTFATIILFDVWAPFAAALAVVLWQRRPILATIRRFASDWSEERPSSALWFGVAILIITLAALMTGMSLFGRSTALLAVGAVTLAVTVINLIAEKRAATKSPSGEGL